MAKGDNTFTITKDLQNTVRTHPQIKEVYFDENGNHYFKKHTITLYTESKETPGLCAGQKDVETLPGATKSILKVKVGKETKDMMVNTGYKAIAQTMTRKEVLDAIPQTKVLSDDEKLEILIKAQEILKSDEGKALLDSLGGK